MIARCYSKEVKLEKTFKVSELIAKLKDIEAKHGDIDVLLAHYEDGYYEIADSYVAIKRVALDYNHVCGYCGQHAGLDEISSEIKEDKLVERGFEVKDVLAIGPMM